jgi:hypothetical protein
MSPRSGISLAHTPAGDDFGWFFYAYVWRFS